MRNFKLATTIVSLMATICFTACDDNDSKKQETNTCTPAACEMAEHATEMVCNDDGHCVVKACADMFKVAEDSKSCVADAPACYSTGTPACEPKCEDGNDCICRDDKWQCVPVDDNKCGPKCEGYTKCECTMDTCSCVPVNLCDGKSAGDECADGKTCQTEGEAIICKDKPVELPVVDDPCKDKEAGAACGDNKVCTASDEGDKLECKDKPADQAPAE